MKFLGYFITALITFIVCLLTMTQPVTYNNHYATDSAVIANLIKSVDTLKSIDYQTPKNQIKNEYKQIINNIYNTPDSGQHHIQLFLLSESERLDSLGFE